MPNPRMKHRRVVHKSTAGILRSIPEAVGLVGNPPPGLTNHTVALPLAGETTEGEAGCENPFFNSLLGNKRRRCLPFGMGCANCRIAGNAASSQGRLVR